MDLDIISTEQLEAELNSRKKIAIEKEKESKQILLATANLKHDLFNTGHIGLDFDHWLMTSDEIREVLDDYFKEMTSEKYKQGSKFVLYRLPLYENEELWFQVDEEGNEQDLIEMSLEWGRLHLENVKEVEYTIDITIDIPVAI